MNLEFDEIAIHGKLRKREIHFEKRIKLFGIIIREISYFPNQ